MTLNPKKSPLLCSLCFAVIFLLLASSSLIWAPGGMVSAPPGQHFGKDGVNATLWTTIAGFARQIKGPGIDLADDGDRERCLHFLLALVIVLTAGAVFGLLVYYLGTKGPAGTPS